MAAISHVFTIACVADMLGEDEEWLHELSLGMDPEDGQLWVYDTGEREVPAFTREGITYLQELITEARANGSAPMPKAKT